MKLSIVIPAYNVENHIKKTLTSVLCQTNKQLELIIVNDGSTDGTTNLLEEILSRRNDLDYKIITKENGGVSSARNRGLMEAAGDYIMFLDGDDYIAEDLVERIYETLENRTVALDTICWGYNTVDAYGTVLKNYFDEFEHVNQEITGIAALKNIFVYRTMWICTGSAAFRKKLLTENQLKYTEGCFNGEDQEFTIKVLSRVKNAVFINKTLLFYVQREGSVSNSLNIKKFDVIDAINRALFYLHNSNEDLTTISNMIQVRNMVENFFGSLDSCISNSKIGPLLYEMNEKYPGLNKDMKETMKLYQGGNVKIRIKCKLYLISPNLYARFVLLKRSVKLKKSGAIERRIH